MPVPVTSHLRGEVVSRGLDFPHCMGGPRSFYVTPPVSVTCSLARPTRSARHSAQQCRNPNKTYPIFYKSLSSVSTEPDCLLLFHTGILLFLSGYRPDHLVVRLFGARISVLPNAPGLQFTRLAERTRPTVNRLAERTQAPVLPNYTQATTF